MARLPEPFDRELLIFAGKGGVGKTTTASAVALRAAAAGRRTLLVTVDPAQRLEDALGVPVGHRVRQVRGKLSAMMLDPEKVIEEFVRELAPDRNLTQHPLYKYISNYMPGINELLAIGKLVEFRREKDFDTIIVDTAPTGHALSFLTTPLKIRDLLRENLLIKWAVRGYGLYQRVSKGGRALQGLFRQKDALPAAPEVDLEKLFEDISQRAGDIHALLQDDRRTSLILVTNPEKLPVEETVDLHEYITRELGIPIGAIVVNKVSPDTFGVAAGEFARLLRDERARRDMQAALAKHGYAEGLLAAITESARFEEQRHHMNVDHLRELAERLPAVPRILVALQDEDVYGLERLGRLETQLFDAFLETIPTQPT